MSFNPVNPFTDTHATFHNITDITGRNPANNYDKQDEKFGFDLALDSGPYMLKAEWMRGDTSEIEAKYWYVMPGYLLSKVSSIPVDFFLRYSEADFDESSVAGITSRGFWTSAAWDKSQWTALAKWHLHPRAKVYFEYYWNDIDEPSGTNVRSNDYAFIELILLY